jgi:acyl dehydratase
MNAITQIPAPLAIGQSASIEWRCTAFALERFAAVTGDHNPIHTEGPPEKRIAHGLLVEAMISTLLGTALPGAGTKWLRKRVEYIAPVHPGDLVKATVEVTEMRGRAITLHTWCGLEDGTLVLDGESVVIVPRDRVTAASQPRQSGAPRP